MSNFGDLSSAAGLTKLEAHLAATGFVTASCEDKKVASQVCSVDAATYPAIARWQKAVSGETEAEAEEDEDDVDLFGSSDEEVDEEAERIKQQRLEEYRKKKEAKGPGPAAKTTVTLDVKAWDDETDMEALTQNVLKIELDGLVWGGHQLVPVGFGMNKLQINCVVEDEKISLDDLAELIQEDEDNVQSVDVAAMQKI